MAMKIMRSTIPHLFFSRQEKKHIITAIQTAELRTSGEIRVHLQRRAQSDIVQHAVQVFEKIGMAATEQRNGVLIFLGIRSKRFAIIGDEGINAKVPPYFWQESIACMQKHFEQDQFAAGIVAAIDVIGQNLQEHFPYQRDDENELPDEISYSW